MPPLASACPGRPWWWWPWLWRPFFAFKLPSSGWGWPGRCCSPFTLGAAALLAWLLLLSSAFSPGSFLSARTFWVRRHPLPIPSLEPEEAALGEADVADARGLLRSWGVPSGRDEEMARQLLGGGLGGRGRGRSLARPRSKYYSRGRTRGPVWGDVHAFGYEELGRNRSYRGEIILTVATE